MNKLHKKDMGSIGEALVVSQIYENGCVAFHEFGDNSKVDLIIEDKVGALHKIQVKTVGREEREPEVTKLYLFKSGPNYRVPYTKEMIDWFAVVDFITKKIAWMSIKEALETSSFQLVLRHTPPKKKQVKKMRYFDNYMKFPF